VNKQHAEFPDLDLGAGWVCPDGYPDGIEERVLSGGLDTAAKQGSRTRLVRFAPGAFTSEAYSHDYFEEAFLVSGDLTVGNDSEGNGGQSFVAPNYACRPPGTPHGPVKSTKGCLVLEIHYYDPA